MIKLIVADDHKIVREGLRAIINKTSDIQVIDEARNGSELLSKVIKNEYDVILLDISMPGRSGLDILKQLKKEKPHIQVLILSMYSEEEFAVRAMKTGAAGYLVKDTASKDLIDAIRKVSMGLKFINPFLIAYSVSWAFVFIFILSNIRLLYELTVLGLTEISSAISLFFLPVEIIRITSYSRFDNLA